MLMYSHKKLDVWKLAIEIVSDVYCLTSKFPKSELFSLTQQLRRSAVSIPSNIAEGCSRSSPNERKRFFEIARSSMAELDTQIEISIRVEYLKMDETRFLESKFFRLFAMLSKLISSTK